MAKKNVDAIESASGMMSEFWSKLLKKVKAKGGKPGALHQLSTPAGDNLIDQFADSLIGNLKSSGDDGFKVTVDYSQTLKQMIAAGKFDWRNSDITEKHFPLPKIAAGLSIKTELNLELVHFNHSISSDEALAELKKRGMRPATLPELLAFAAGYPDKQREFFIVALGSAWRDWDGYRGIPFLWDGGHERYLDLGWFEDGWSSDDRFLAVREV